jgi:hypothetical protein
MSIESATSGYVFVPSRRFIFFRQSYYGLLEARGFREYESCAFCIPRGLAAELGIKSRIIGIYH